MLLCLLSWCALGSLAGGSVGFFPPNFSTQSSTSTTTVVFLRSEMRASCSFLESIESSFPLATRAILFSQVAVMSVFFVVHIHFYGIAQALFGDLGPVVAWPLLMCATVLGGQVWSIFMKEWAGVPKLAVRMNTVSISLIVTALVVIAVAGAIL